MSFEERDKDHDKVLERVRYLLNSKGYKVCKSGVKEWLSKTLRNEIIAITKTECNFLATVLRFWPDLTAARNKKECHLFEVKWPDSIEQNAFEAYKILQLMMKVKYGHMPSKSEVYIVFAMRLQEYCRLVHIDDLALKKPWMQTNNSKSSGDTYAYVNWEKTKYTILC